MWEKDWRYPMLYPFQKGELEWLAAFAEAVEWLAGIYPDIAEGVKRRHWVDEPKKL
jgi:hypothetical protein